MAQSLIPWHEKPGVTVAEACELLGVRLTKLYRLIEEGRLEIFKVDERTQVRVASIQRLIAAGSTKVRSGPQPRRGAGAVPAKPKRAKASSRDDHPSQPGRA